MASERIQRRIEALLDETDDAIVRRDWRAVAENARAVLAIDAANEDALAYLAMAAANLDITASAPTAPVSVETGEQPIAEPQSFAGGRYAVRRFLGEGGKKRVYLAHDALLDRDVAFALIKTEGLDAVGRERVQREAQAMGRMGAHPHVVSIFDFGEEAGAPYVVTELMGGGDVEGLLKAEGPLPLAQTLEIGKAVARGLVFAHQQGVVHRDLKPGNVWLTADGVAKIGDFGLAVALDRPRLTQHGLMVGTVAYMPPEQALGGEVTPQSDLYSLGAMLYELVTGRPPFEADDVTAVISQHINTPPVAPSWRSEHCPPELEALILRCLEKAPAARPTSAEEVLAALEAVDPEARSASHSDASANPLDRLARGVFVGRAGELERLRGAFDEAFAGRGSVVMLVGEPGIGKTRTSLELETYARMRGGRVIWGRAHEAAGAPPYRPWVQAADTYSSTWGLDAIGARLAPDDTAELSRIFPLLRQQPGYLTPPAIVDPAAAQFRLFEAYTKLLRAFASDAPLVVVLDDLHWADKPTLLLLQHVARELARLRVLIVGTYRDTELSRTHPLSEALAELNREGGFQRVHLGGLLSVEVAAYIRGTAGIEPSPSLVERVHEETEGNPFFLAEVVNLMTEEGTIGSDSVSDIAIPEGVREALGRRLDRLSEEASALLQYAAVAGREFAYDTLKLVTDHDDDMLLRLIEEGLSARVIEETPPAGRYQFTHALMQETLLEELSTTRRVRMHGEVGEAIERRYGERADEQAARLAAHYLESAALNADHRARAIRYATIAGRSAEASSGWSEALRQYDRALMLVNDSGDGASRAEVADLHLAHGRCALKVGEGRAAWRSLLRAIDAYRSLGDGVNQARAAREAMEIMAPFERLAALARDALEALKGQDPHLEASLLAFFLQPRERALDPGEVEEARERVAHLLREHDYEDVKAAVSEAEGRGEQAQGHFGRAAELFQSAHASFVATGRVTEAARTLWQTSSSPLLLGRLDEGIEAARAALHYGSERHVDLWAQNAAAHLAGALLCRWDFEAFDALVAQHPGVGTYMTPSHRAARLEAEGRVEESLRWLPDPAASGGQPSMLAGVRAIRARLLWNAGRIEEAKAEFELFLDPFHMAGAFEPAIHGSASIASLDEALLEFATRDLLEDALNFARRLSQRENPDRLIYQPWSARCVLRVFASVAHRAGEPDQAAIWFQDALEWCERERCPVEAGRCHQGLAEVAERRGDHALAMQHLDAAGELFSRYGAKLYLDQVLAKKEILKA